MGVSSVVVAGGTVPREGEGESRGGLGQRGGTMWGVSGAGRDARTGLKAGRTTVVTYHNR